MVLYQYLSSPLTKAILLLDSRVTTFPHFRLFNLPVNKNKYVNVRINEMIQYVERNEVHVNDTGVDEFKFVGAISRDYHSGNK